jgi:short subunit dehydrogenase-like uncharacterized protein
MSFLIYGANGYTGRLIVEMALAKGLKPVIAGRNQKIIQQISEETGLEYRIFDLESTDSIAEQLKNFPLVLNCAGPFSKTAVQMVEACLKSNTHYLDITGEIEVFETLKTYDAQAKEKNIILMPGVGFDVVPTDCCANYLHRQMPDASSLELAFMSLGGSISHGTLSTMVEGLGRKGVVRKEGILVPVPTGHKGKVIDFGLKKAFCMTIPWGDISTAHHTTGIPNIEAYTAVPRWIYYVMKLQFLFNPLLRCAFVKKIFQHYIDKKIIGPSKEQNEKGKSLVWGRVCHANGETKEVRFEGPETYKLTALAALVITQKVLQSKNIAGYQTPAGMFGYELLNEIEGCRIIEIWVK